MQAGTAAKPVGSFTLFQMNNQGLDAAWRVGGPIAAYFLWEHGYKKSAGAIALVAAISWGNRVLGWNL